MHIGDGVLPAAVWVPAEVVAAGVLVALLPRAAGGDRLPRVALCTAFFFVASLVHVPVGPASVHLTLTGLVGMVAGPAAFVPVQMGLVLQALLFQHGGITTLGVNGLVMSLPAYAAWGVWRLSLALRGRWVVPVGGFLAGWVAVNLAVALLAVVLASAGRQFLGLLPVLVAAHQPLAVVEGLVTASAALFLRRVQPALVGG